MGRVAFNALVSDHWDYLIVGAGFSGLVLAERFATQLGKRSLILEKRDHVGGNANDYYDEAGVLVHQYGPHYFRTNSSKIKDYLSQFTEWQPVDYQILSYTEGRYWNFPINLNTFEQLIGHESTSEAFAQYLEEKRVLIDNPKNSEEVIISQVGWELYKKFFLGYTLKQWKRHPKDLDASVCGRIPIRTNRDDRYLKESFQALPKQGYHRLFENMITAAGNKVAIRLNTDYRDVLHEVTFDKLIFTGMIDEFYDCKFGRLPYRSLRFEHESFSADALQERAAISGKAGLWQPAMQVNYPNDEAFTRIVEMKHATQQDCSTTTIVREYPDDFIPDKREPYYPIPNDETAALYRKYKTLADAEKNVYFVGRLATYRYYNMDQVVGMALSCFERIQKEH